MPSPIPLGGSEFTSVTFHDGTTQAGQLQILRVEGAGRATATPHSRTQGAMDVPRIHPPGRHL